MVQLSPPLICGQEEIDFIAGTLREVLTEAWRPALSGPHRTTASGTSRAATRLQRLSLWWEAVAGPAAAAPRSTEDLDVDVCIVGAGFTGLWTAHALAQADPSLRIAVVEREVAGFGASGRNGGWCSALVRHVRRRAGPPARASTRCRRCAAPCRRRSTFVGASAASEGIDCHFAKGGSVDLVRSEAQRARAMAEVDEARALGFGEDDLRWLGPDEAREADRRRRRPRRDRSRRTAPCCSRPCWPAGWPTPSNGAGVRIYEHTEVLAIDAGEAGDRPSVRTRGGPCGPSSWCAPSRPGRHPARAGAGDRPGVLPHGGHRAPRGRLLVDRPGWTSRATFADHRHMIIYGQRTADDRIAFGGRGAPYHFGSTISPASTASRRCTSCSRQTLAELFPEVAGAASPMPGAARSASRATGTPRSASTAPRAWPGPAATWATACPRPTWPGARWPT